MAIEGWTRRTGLMGRTRPERTRLTTANTMRPERTRLTLSATRPRSMAETTTSEKRMRPTLTAPELVRTRTSITSTSTRMGPTRLTNTVQSSSRLSSSLLPLLSSRILASHGTTLLASLWPAWLSSASSVSSSRRPALTRKRLMRTSTRRKTPHQWFEPRWHHHPFR